MKKMIALSLISASLLVGCGPNLPMRNFAAAPGVRSMSTAPATGARPLNLNKSDSPAIKSGAPSLQISQFRGFPKQAAAFQISIDPTRRDASTSEVMTIARIGLDGMERARTYQDGYNIGRSTIDSLAGQNSYIARLTQAATNPEMKYETAYKAVAKALAFIANNRDISVSSTCDLVREMLNAAKTYDDGARIGYATMAFIRQSASPSIQAVIDASVRSAQTARYWEDAYNILFQAYGSIRNMN
ncbi:MAG TPA: hypothetical protein V6D23_18065 [Candidatus Obscuribacterales bacterium]